MTPLVAKHVRITVVIVALLAAAALLVAPAAQRVGWQRFTDAPYHLSLRYPEDFALEHHYGHSDFDGDFLAVDLGPPGDIAKLDAANAGPGSGGPPLYFRLTAQRGVPIEGVRPDLCGEMRYVATFTIDGLPAVQCEELTLGSFPSVMVLVSTGYEYVIMTSDQYDGDRKRVIDLIVRTLRFTK